MSSRHETYQRIELVVNSALDAGQGFDAGEFQHEAMQVTFEFHRAMPRLESKRGGPHVQKLVLKNAGDSQSVMRLVPSVASSASLSLSNSSLSSMVNPIDVTSTAQRFLSTRRAMACEICCSLNAMASSYTVRPRAPRKE